MLCANTKIELVGEKIAGEKKIETNELVSVESLLNHMDLNDEININSLINTKIRERMWKWIESSLTNITIQNF